MWFTVMKHGDCRKWTRNKLYRKYMNIVGRCNRPYSISYKNYGARWIKCLWETYEDFKRDMWQSYDEHVKKYGEENTTIDRINNEWHYCKENCKRSTRKEQANNRRSCKKCMYRWVEYNSIKEMAVALWMNECATRRITYRIKAWWDIESAVNKPWRIYL